MGFWYITGRSLTWLCFSAFSKWKVEGREAVPPKGPLIVISNHLSNADPPLLAAAIGRQLHFVGKRSLFSNPVSAYFLRSVGVHPAARDGADIEALRWNLDLLKNDGVMALFPEGTRGRGLGMIRGHPGAAYIAARSQAPILPVAITGTENVPGYWRIAFPMTSIKVTFGEPFSLPIIEGKLSRPILENLSDMMMSRVAALLPPSYRGYYGVGEATTQS